jgi:hypothetical protein
MGMRREERAQHVCGDRLHRPLVKRTQLGEVSRIGATRMWRMIGMSQIRKKCCNQRLQ